MKRIRFAPLVLIVALAAGVIVGPSPAAESPVAAAPSGAAADDPDDSNPGVRARSRSGPRGPNVGRTDGRAEVERLRGQVAYLDPETGQLRETAPEGARWPVVDPAFVRSVTGAHDDVRQYELPNGWAVAGRPGGFRSSLMATVDADGTVRLKHVSATALRGEAPAAGDGSPAESPAQHDDEGDDDVR
jgi:hypothetical protein